MEDTGQMTAAAIFAVIGMIVAVSIGGLLFGAIQESASDQVEDTGITTTTELVDTGFADNTGSTLDQWDNAMQTATLTWNSTGYAVVATTDNGRIGSAADNMSMWENAWVMQSISLGTLQDGVTGMTVTYRYRVLAVENRAPGVENYDSITAVVTRPGGDNVTMSTVRTDSTGDWTTVENTSDIINAAGTYTLNVRVNIRPDSAKIGSNIQIGIDDANLAVYTYSNSLAENIVGNVSETGGDAFPLVLLAVLVSVFIVILTMFKVLG